MQPTGPLRCTADPTTPAFPAGPSSSQAANLPSYPLSTRLPGFVPSSLCNLVFLNFFFFFWFLLLRSPLRTLQLFALLVPFWSTPTSISIIIIITTSSYFRRHQSNSKHRLTKAPIARTLCLVGRTAQRLIPLFSWCQDGRRNPAGPGHINHSYSTLFRRTSYSDPTCLRLRLLLNSLLRSHPRTRGQIPFTIQRYSMPRLRIPRLAPSVLAVGSTVLEAPSTLVSRQQGQDGQDGDRDGGPNSFQNSNGNSDQSSSDEDGGGINSTAIVCFLPRPPPQLSHSHHIASVLGC